MTHYVVIGNGVAGIEAAMTIRRRLEPSEASITVISKETDFFFSRTALMYAYMNQMERQDLEPYERRVWDEQQISLTRAEVTNLNANSKTLTLNNKETISYDKLLIATGSKPRHIPFEGIDKVKEGVVNFVSMQDLDACEQLTWEAESAVVVGGGLIGIELVECLQHHKVQTTFLVREKTYWPVALSPKEGEIVSSHIREHGVDLRHEEELAKIEVDAQGKLQGIVTNLGNKIPCQILGLCIGVVAAVDWLKETDTPPEIERALVVDTSFKTSLPDVWGAGDCVQISQEEGDPIRETIWYSAKRHGRLAALAMMEDHVSYTPPLFFNSSKFFEIEYTTVGDVVFAPKHAKGLWRTHPKREDVTQLITYDPEQNNRVLGFNLLGSRWNHRILERWIMERRSVDFVKEKLTDAQYDVEFGKIDLKTMNETEIAL